MIFEDTFTAASLDVTKWNPYMGDDQYKRWGDQGRLASPYSGMNCDSTCSNSFQIQYYDPYPYGFGTSITGNSLVGGNGNLRFIMKASNYFSNLGYSFSSASVTSFDKLYLPATGGYVQFRAKMPDSRYGAWAGLWLLSANGPEIDVIESGYTLGTANPNNLIASNFHGSGASQVIKDSGKDLSADYHVYGMEYRPGQSIKIYLDGQLIASYTSGIPTNAKYQILMDIEVAGPNARGWHTIADAANHPGPFYLDVSHVQIYGLP